MTYQATTTIVLDPVKDATIIMQYEKDENWIKKGESTISAVFEFKSPLYVLNEAIYIDMRGEDFKNSQL